MEIKRRLMLESVVVVAYAALLAGCGDAQFSDLEGEAYDLGHSDGYAVGYNTACEIRATMIDGDWGSADYSRGYSDGVVEGITVCNRDRESDTLP